MSKKFTRIALFLTYFLLAGYMGSVMPQTSDIPSSRLGSSYASPGGEYTVQVPFLVKPGARIQEGTDPLNQFVLFADDYGKQYRILSRDNQTGEVTFEQLESGLIIGESPFGPILEKEVVTTIRGQELRLLTVTENGSPLVSRSRVDGKTVERALDLVEAVSIFIHGDRVYTVSAGVTPLSGQPEAADSVKAKENLETFLEGLSLFDEPSIEVAGSDDAEILEVAEAAITVASNHGFQSDGSDSENERVEVKPIDSRTLESDQSIGVGIRAFCEREYERASEILRPHAEQGNVDAQVILAFMLWDGVDVRQNRDEALSWFRKAADKGDGEAQVFLGHAYSNGDGVKVDFNEAVKWFSKAAEAGISEGQYNLAYAHTIGAGGVVKDEAKAAELFTIAANQDHVWAQSNLGHMYLYGTGVKIDKVRAYKWLLLDSEEGDKPAKQLLGEIRPSMTGGEIKEAERLANSFVPMLSPAEQRLAQRCRESYEPSEGMTHPADMVQEQVDPPLFDEPSIEVAGSADVEILEAVDAAITVAKNHGYEFDASDSENGRIVVKALWKGHPVTLTMRFFRKEGGLYIASAMEQPGDVALSGGGTKIEQIFYPDLFEETTRRGLSIYGDPRATP